MHIRWKNHVPPFLRAFAILTVAFFLEPFLPLGDWRWLVLGGIALGISYLPFWKEYSPAFAQDLEVVVEDDREWCPLSKEELVGLVKGKTGVMQDNTTKGFKGTWLRVSGRVNDVEDRYESITVHLDCKDEPSVFCNFKKKDKKQLEQLQKGEKFSAEGQLRNIGGSFVSLENCRRITTNQPDLPRLQAVQ